MGTTIAPRVKKTNTSKGPVKTMTKPVFVMDKLMIQKGKPIQLNISIYAWSLEIMHFLDLLKLLILGNLHIRKRQGLLTFCNLKVMKINL